MSQLNPKFIYFDLDDTLLDHKKAEKAGLSDVHDHFEEIQKVSMEELLDTYHRINKGLWEEYGKGDIDRHILHRRRFEETFRELKINTGLWEQAGKVYMNYYRNHWEWIEGAKEAYERIAEKFPVGIITNGFAETQKLKIDQFRLKETAKQIIISEELGVMKPDPQIFRHAEEKAGAGPEEILYVGDSLTSDVIGGSNAGWSVAWYTEKPVEEGTERANLTFQSFDLLLDKLHI
ncbi:YjjG family noncanonical pyrimidine nucleotidase [Balneola sp. MJW-20]|uniref:YjjG family noncanonical pyrimidine nucleotidase n=1 Tax=Gracilimonas aurantiaca TaxID=3234185 RepID=UPI0034653B29